MKTNYRTDVRTTNWAEDIQTMKAVRGVPEWLRAWSQLWTEKAADCGPKVIECMLRNLSYMTFRKSATKMTAVNFIMLRSPPGSVGEGVMFSGCLVHSFVRPERCCYHDIS